MTKQITLIENQLSDMNFYHKEPETYKVCALQVEELKHQLGSKEQKWLELEKYKSLQAQIDKRLQVLDPLIDQLEKVADALLQAYKDIK